MEKVLEGLPDLKISSDEDSDDDAEGKSSTIFSHSAHLKLLGVELTGVNFNDTTPNVSMQQHSPATSNVTEYTISHYPNHTQDCPAGDPSKGVSEYSNDESPGYSEDSGDVFEYEVNWDKFKSEFTESLQASEEKIASEQREVGEIPIHNLKQQLLVDAILAMHTETQTDNDTGNGSSVTGTLEGPRSPSKLRRNLLSISTLETIHEAELDRLLEADVQVLSDGQAPNSGRDKGHSPSPAPKLVWEKEDTGQLMRDLEQLNRRETRKTPSTTAESWQQPGNWTSYKNESAYPIPNVKSKENGPIFLDLRPSLEERKTAKDKSDDSNDRSTSDDESDDPFSWIAQRNHIKHNLHTTHAPHPHALSSPPSFQPHTRNLKSQKESMHKTTTPTAQTKLSEPHQSVHVDSATQASTSTDPAQTAVDHPIVSAGARRQRNSSSLTLSSSYSDGEVNSSEGSKENTGITSTTGSQNKDKKSSKKGSKKSKKSRKKDKEANQVKDSSKSAQRKQARALVLERLRNDSLTTSSDEEHCLTPTENGGLSCSVSSGDSGPVFQGSEDDLLSGIDTDKLKLRLQKIIQAKKPPTQFVTPATCVLFHEDVSFEDPLVSMDPSRSTDALFVFPLSGDGLVALPTEVEEEGENFDIQTQLFFHLVLLTWLSIQAATDHQGNADSDGDPSQLEGKEMGTSSVGDQCFWLTGLQQTMLDGCPTVLAGVSLPPQLKANQDVFFGGNSDTDLTSSTSSVLTSHLAGLTLGTLLDPVLGHSQVTGLIPDRVLDNLHLLNTLPLTSILSVHDDVTSLSTPLSFYWHSGYHISSLPSDESLKSLAPVSTTACIIPSHSLTNPSLVFSIFHSVYHNALYLGGLRVVYGESSAGGDVTLALAVRAPDAIYRWLDIVGPEDCALAKLTDPNSLNAKFGSTKSAVVQCLRTPYSVTSTLAKWFGGRACLKTGSVLGISDPRTKFERRKRQRVRFSESESEDGLPSPALEVTFPPLTSNRPCLIAQPYTKTLLIVAPLVSPALYGCVLSICSRCGFDILGMKRIRLNSKRAAVIQIPKAYVANFTPSSAPPSPALEFVTHPLATEHAPPFPSLLLHLGAENAQLHSMALKEAIFSDLRAVLNANPSLPGNFPHLQAPQSILHTAEVSREAVKVLGSFSLSNTVSGSPLKLHSDRIGRSLVFDELCLVAVPQCNSLPKLITLLNRVYRVRPLKGQPQSETEFSPDLDDGVSEGGLGGFELLGLKIVPQIPRFHAKRLCPLASSEPSYQAAVNTLSDAPATLLLFRGLNCNQRLTSLLKPSRAKSPLHTSTLQQQLETIVSKNFEDAYNLSSIFFTDKEMFADSVSLGLARYIPPSWLQDTSILHDLQMLPDPLLSVARVCLSDNTLAVKVLDKLCRSGFRVVGMRAMEMGHKDRETVVEDLESEEAPIDGRSSEPVLVVCVLRMNAVWHLRHTLMPFLDQRRPKAKNTPRVFCSESYRAAVAEVSEYFPRGVCCDVNMFKQECKVDCEMRDTFDGLFLPESCRCLPDSCLLDFVSPLLETTVMVLSPSLLEQRDGLSTPGCVEVIEFLTECGFEVRGLKMVLVSRQLSEEMLRVCCSVSSMKADDLCCGPCIVLVLRRDNAASCSQSIFKSALLRLYRPGPTESVEALLQWVLVPASAKEAQDMLKLVQIENKE